MTTAQQLMTAEEFASLPDPKSGEQMELVRGVVAMAPPASTGHGRRSFKIGEALERFISAHGLGLQTSEGGYQLGTNPDVVRAPDAAWLSAGRIPGDGLPEGYFKGAPDLAVEVVSRNDRDTDIATKVADYLAAGSQRVWVVRPQQRTVTVHRGSDSHTYGLRETLSSDDAGFPIDGFELRLTDIFETT